MSESVRPSSSQTAMSIAFKKARRKFPKNFGLTSTRAEKDSSENEDSSSSKNEQDPKSTVKAFDPANEKIYQKSIPEDVETGLIDGLKEVELTEQPQIICNLYPDKLENFASVDLKLDLPIVGEHEKCESVYDEQQEFTYDYGYEQLLSLTTYTELPTKPDPSNFTYHETRQSIGLIWNNESDHDDNYDTEIDEEPPRKYEETSTRRKRQSHRRKKSSHCHSDHIYEDERFELYSSSCCACHEYCSHCQHYHRHCNCCRTHYCCCTRCCLIWQERAVVADESCPSCRRRRSKKKRCSACNGKRRPSSPSITCSRDSGISTQTRYEDYDDDDKDTSATLMHKDSLSILQEKYAKKNPSRRDDDEAERTKGKKSCKRIANRYSIY